MGEWTARHKSLLRGVVGLDNPRVVDRVLAYAWISVIYSLFGLPNCIAILNLLVLLLVPAPWTLLSGSASRYWVNLFFSAPLAAVHCYAIVDTLASDTSTQTDYIVWLPYYQFIAAALLANVVVSIVRIRASNLAASGGTRALPLHPEVAQQ